jgi:hypothetical protein
MITRRLECQKARTPPPPLSIVDLLASAHHSDRRPGDSLLSSRPEVRDPLLSSRPDVRAPLLSSRPEVRAADRSGEIWPRINRVSVCVPKPSIRFQPFPSLGRLVNAATQDARRDFSTALRSAPKKLTGRVPWLHWRSHVFSESPACLRERRHGTQSKSMVSSAYPPRVRRTAVRSGGLGTRNDKMWSFPAFRESADTATILRPDSPAWQDGRLRCPCGFLARARRVCPPITFFSAKENLESIMISERAAR